MTGSQEGGEERGKVKEDRFFNVGRKMHEGNKRGMSER